MTVPSSSLTSFVDVERMVRWIRDTGVDVIISGLVQAIDYDFCRWEQFEKTARIASHTPLGVIELRPTTDGETYGFKYVNGHPLNPSRGFQTVTAFGVLADVDNGYPTFLAEMTLLTALRTAAMSALAARALARPSSRTMALIGTGSQAEFQAIAMRGAIGITDLRIFDTDPDAMAKLARNLRQLGFAITAAGSAAEAAFGADVVTTCTADKVQATVLTAADVAPGVHINAIGGDCPGKTELDPAILDNAAVFVEYEAQTRIEGEIQARDAGFAVTELWRVLTGAASGRRSATEITLFDSVGFAIEDFSALRYTRDAVRGTAYEEYIHLVAAPDNPKDLFGMIFSPVPVR